MSKNNPTISVIVPVYNTSIFLPKCINSILTQSFKDFELILVNDASTDNSLSIIKSYANKDDRIVIIDKKINEGLERARLFSGLDAAVVSDYWKSYNELVPEEQPVQTKAETYTIESYNGQIRHFLARFRRKTKC
jgi:glycosyltransferase involved in cell wall biosynthesis